MSDRAFVDTNIVAYLFDDDAPERKARSAQILRADGDTMELVLSTQVLQEFYVAVTRKLERPLAGADALVALQSLAELAVTQLDSAASPEVVGRIGGQVTSVDVENDHAFLGVGRRVHIIDTSIPSEPQLVARSPLMVASVRALDAFGNHVYLAVGDHGIVAVDLSDPHMPRVVGGSDNNLDVTDVTMGDDGLHAFLSTRTGLAVIDVSDPKQM